MKNGVINPDTVSVPGWTMGKPKFSAYTAAYSWGSFTHFEAHFPVETSPVGFCCILVT